MEGFNTLILILILNTLKQLDARRFAYIYFIEAVAAPPILNRGGGQVIPKQEWIGSFVCSLRLTNQHL